MSEIDDAIVKLLAQQNNPVTYSYIDVILPDWDFVDVSRAVDNLKKSGVVSVGMEGVSLISPIADSSPKSDQQKTHSNSKYDADIEYLSYDVLIGDSEFKNEEDYQTISEDELRELIRSIEAGPSILDYSDEKTIGAEPEKPLHSTDTKELVIETISDADVPFLHYFDSTDVLDVSNRIKNSLSKNGLNTVGDLIAKFSVFMDMQGLGAKSKEELRHYISSGARKGDSTLTHEQLDALRCLSNNYIYYFDAFGTLSVAKDAIQEIESLSVQEDDQDLEDTILSSSIDVLAMGDAVTRCFKRNGITTVGALASTSDESLLKLRGIGIQKIEVARDALNRLLKSEPSCIAKAIEGEIENKINVLAYKEFLSEYKGETVNLLSDCAAELSQMGIALFNEAFLVYYLPLSSDAILISDGDIDAAKELILESIAESSSANDAFKESFEAQLQFARTNERAERVECTVRVPEAPIWRKLALEVVEQADDCVFDEVSGKVKFNHPSLQDWILSLPERDAELISNRLRGLTLDECGKRAGITRERVRQVTTKLLNQRPILEEDSYRFFYTTYDVDKTNFTLLTGADVKVGNYLDLTIERRDRQNLSLSGALSDELVSDDIKNKIRTLLNKDFVFVDGERVHKDRRSIILYLVNKLTERSSITINELQEAYGRFLKEHDLTLKSLVFNNLHNFQEWTRRNVPEMLNVKSGEDGFIRYYDASQYDYSKLKDFFTSGLFENIECSSALIFNHPQATEIIEELDIRDEYELHYIAKNYCDLPNDIIFGRMPTITFGDGDREKQILELIQEKGPIDVSTLASLYHEKYGVAETTFKGTYLKGFEIYKSHGSYSCSFEEMSSEQLETLSSLLTNDYHSMSLVKLQFKDKHPSVSTSLVNKLNLAKIGYRPSHELLVRTNLNEKEIFEKLIDDNASFGLETTGFISEIFRHPVFDSVLQIRINALDVIEYEKNKYIHLDAVLSAIDEDASRADFEDYVEKVLEATNKGEPFTVYSLRKSGFDHPVEMYADEVGFGDEFFESLISTARVGGRLKSTSASNRVIFCKTPYSFSVIDLFETVLSELKSIDVEDLCAFMKERYDIDIIPSLARSIIRRSELFFHEDLDRVFESSEEYDRMVHEILSR